jgi:large subunit ribosomal protein L10
MAITKEKKNEIVKKIEDIASRAKTLVWVQFKGLNVAQQTEMRKALRAQGIGYTVAKKTLVERGLASAKFEGTAPALEGEVALAYAPDPASQNQNSDELAPARELAVFVKKFADTLAFAGGVFGGKYVDKAGIMAIAAIPGMEALRGMFAQVINSPRSRFAVVLSEVAKTKNS